MSGLPGPIVSTLRHKTVVLNAVIAERLRMLIGQLKRFLSAYQSDKTANSNAFTSFMNEHRDNISTYDLDVTKLSTTCKWDSTMPAVLGFLAGLNKYRYNDSEVYKLVSCYLLIHIGIVVQPEAVKAKLREERLRYTGALLLCFDSNYIKRTGVNIDLDVPYGQSIDPDLVNNVLVETAGKTINGVNATAAIHFVAANNKLLPIPHFHLFHSVTQFGSHDFNRLNMESAGGALYMEFEPNSSDAKAQETLRRGMFAQTDEQISDLRRIKELEVKLAAEIEKNNALSSEVSGMKASVDKILEEFGIMKKASAEQEKTLVKLLRTFSGETANPQNATQP